MPVGWLDSSRLVVASAALSVAALIVIAIALAVKRARAPIGRSMPPTTRADVRRLPRDEWGFQGWLD